MSAVTSSVQKVLTAADFPRALVKAIGEDTLAQMSQVTVTETGTGYLDGCFSLDMIPAGGAIKGTDQLGRAFITFAVTNPNYRKIEQERATASEAGYEFPSGKVEETVLATVLQRNSNGRQWVYKWPAIPTNDFRFWGGDSRMNTPKYDMIEDIFSGIHPDLSLYKNQPPADALKV